MTEDHSPPFFKTRHMGFTQRALDFQPGKEGQLMEYERSGDHTKLSASSGDVYVIEDLTDNSWAQWDTMQP